MASGFQTRDITDTVQSDPIAVSPGRKVTIGLKADGGTYAVLIGLDPDDPTDLITQASGLTDGLISSSVTGFNWIAVKFSIAPTSTTLQVLESNA